MESKTYIERLTRRYMAQALDEYERRIERPLKDHVRQLEDMGHVSAPRAAAILGDSEDVRRRIRGKFMALGGDCADLMPGTLEINAYEPVRRRR